MPTKARLKPKPNLRRTGPPLRVKDDRCLLASTNEGDLVLDPFLGGGTSAVACLRLKRGCIGIELDEAHAKLSVHRIIAELERKGRGQPRMALKLKRKSLRHKYLHTGLKFQTFIAVGKRVEQWTARYPWFCR